MDWCNVPSTEALITLGTSQADELLRIILERIGQVLQSTAAHSSRNETLHWLMTSVVWHVAGPCVRLAFVEHLLQPQLLSQHVSGIPRVTGMNGRYTTQYAWCGVRVQPCIWIPRKMLGMCSASPLSLHPPAFCCFLILGGPAGGFEHRGEQFHWTVHSQLWTPISAPICIVGM
jgi:hypothetical protein